MKEVTYHQELASEWVIRLGDGTEESRRRMQDGLDWNWRFIPELFDMDELAHEGVARGFGKDGADRAVVILAEQSEIGSDAAR